MCDSSACFQGWFERVTGREEVSVVARVSMPVQGTADDGHSSAAQHVEQHHWAARLSPSQDMDHIESFL